jgi:hypothetical protein
MRVGGPAQERKIGGSDQLGEGNHGFPLLLRQPLHVTFAAQRRQQRIGARF